MKYDFTNLDRIIEKMKTKTINKTEPSVVEFHTVNRMTAEEMSHYGPNDKRFDTDWTVGRRELRYRVSSVDRIGIATETFIFSVIFDENGEEEPTYDPVQTMYIYRENLYEHKNILEEWVRDVCRGTPHGKKHVFDW